MMRTVSSTFTAFTTLSTFRFLTRFYFYDVCVGMACQCRSCGNQKRALDTLELEAAVSRLMWVLGTELSSLQEQRALLTSELPLY